MQDAKVEDVAARRLLLEDGWGTNASPLFKSSQDLAIDLSSGRAEVLQSYAVIISHLWRLKRRPPESLYQEIKRAAEKRILSRGDIDQVQQREILDKLDQYLLDLRSAYEEKKAQQRRQGQATDILNSALNKHSYVWYLGTINDPSQQTFEAALTFFVDAACKRLLSSSTDGQFTFVTTSDPQASSAANTVWRQLLQGIFRSLPPDGRIEDADRILADLAESNRLRVIGLSQSPAPVSVFVLSPFSEAGPCALEFYATDRTNIICTELPDKVAPLWANMCLNIEASASGQTLSPAEVYRVKYSGHVRDIVNEVVKQSPRLPFK